MAFGHMKIKPTHMIHIKISIIESTTKIALRQVLSLNNTQHSLNTPSAISGNASTSMKAKIIHKSQIKQKTFFQPGPADI